CPRRGAAGAVHPHARPARASGDGLERRALSGRHLACGRRLAAHLRRAARSGPIHRGAAVQPRRRLAVRVPHRPDPAGAARIPADRLHLDHRRGGRGRRREVRRAARDHRAWGRGRFPQPHAGRALLRRPRGSWFVERRGPACMRRRSGPHARLDAIRERSGDHPGALSLQQSRVDPRFGQVIAIGSELQSDSRQLTVGLGGFTARGATFQLSYTLTHARDQSSFSCCAASQGFSAPTTAGDPNAREWATSSFERRHSFLGTVTYPITAALEVTAIGRLTSGVPFTPLVGSDVNGDGARNDRALVFDPVATADTAVANGMRALLAGASPGARSCLQTQVGRVAARNSCTGPWQPSLDLQVNWRPGYFGLDRRLTVSLLTVNLLGGLDEWLHGGANLHGWGCTAAPGPVLLYVRGFDPGALQYRYAVNGRFGATAGANGGVIVPFQVALQVHMTVGPDRTRDRLRAAFGGRRGAGGGGRGGLSGLAGGDAQDFA